MTTPPAQAVFPPPAVVSPPQDAAQQNRRALELLARLCGEYVSGADAATANELAAHPDLSLLARLAERHGILPLLALTLRRTRAHTAVANADNILQRAQDIALDNLRLSAELLDVIAALGAAGIDALAYKGPALAQQLYGDLSLRQFCDLDILVEPADVPRALDLLHQRGYADRMQVRPGLVTGFIRTQCEWQLMGAQSGTVIELHWAAFPKYFSLDFPIHRLKRAAVHVSLAGRPIQVPSPDDLFLLLCAHGAKHFWYRLAWLVDIALLLRHHRAGAPDLLRLAESKGVRRIVLLSAALAARILQLELPPAFDNAIHRDPAVQHLADTMLQSLYAGEPPTDKLTENLVLLRCRERWSDRILIALRLASTPGPLEWLKVPLPRVLSWIYPLVRVIRALRYLPRLACRPFPGRQR